MKGLLFGIATGVCGAGFLLTPFGGDIEKNVGLPWLFKIRGPIEAPPDVAVVAINETTARKMGLPPLPRDWPRSVHGRLIEKLVERGAAVIAFDLALDRAKSPEHDLAFARAVERSGRVILFEKLVGKRQPIVDRSGRHSGFVWVERLLPPIAPLAKAAKALAPFPLPKQQVAIYQFWAFKPSAGDAPTMPAVALQLRALNDYPQWLDLLKQAGAPGIDGLPARPEMVARAPEVRRLMRAIRLAFKDDPSLARRVDEAANRVGVEMAKSRDGRLFKALAGLYKGDDHRFINFYGPPGTIATVPYHAVLNGGDPNVDPKSLDFTGKIVFVGYSDLYDPGQPDRFYTVFTRDDGVDLSGVEIAATAFGNLLTDRSLRQSDALASAAILLVFGLVLGMAVYSLPAIYGVPVALTAAALYGYGAVHQFNTADLWLPVTTPSLQLVGALLFGLLGQYLLERRQKIRVSEAISYYLPENVARDLTQGGLDPESLNKVVYGTCLATDMAGFTTISEKLPPKELAAFMNSYFDALSEPLKRNNVDVTEFHADTIMCAWTAPGRDAAVRQNAALAAIDVIEAIDRFNESYEAHPLYARIGLEDGFFYVGHAGGGGRMAYSILGDTANTAARLESLNKHVGTHLLGTQSALEDVRGILLRPIGEFKLVGKADPTPIVEGLAKEETALPAQRELCDRFAEALEAFRTHDWTKAAKLFDAILTIHPDDGPARFYLEVCRSYQAGAQPGDDPAVIHMEAK